MSSKIQTMFRFPQLSLRCLLLIIQERSKQVHIFIDLVVLFLRFLNLEHSSLPLTPPFLWPCFFEREHQLSMKCHPFGIVRWNLCFIISLFYLAPLVISSIFSLLVLSVLFCNIFFCSLKPLPCNTGYQFVLPSGTSFRLLFFFPLWDFWHVLYTGHACLL